MNFNFTEQPEYDLNTALIEETINLYGILVKFLVTTKINVDSTVFGDYSHLKTDGNAIYEMHMLPEISEDWDSGGFDVSQFGLMNLDNITLFVAKSNFEDLDHNEVSEIVGNLIVLPNNKIMEVTYAELSVPGVNNLFTFNDTKSVYRLNCKPYDAKIINELVPADISYDGVTDYTTLDTYFQELVTDSNLQDAEAEVTPAVDTIQKGTGIDTIVKKPIVDKTEDDVWGNLG